MASLFEAGARQALLARIDRLTPERQPLWGRMSAPRMLMHIGDQMRQALGELEVAPVPGPLAHRPLNWLLIHVVPWPKGKAKSPPALCARESSDWAEDHAELKRLIERFASRGPELAWARSPVFGRISREDWGVLCHRHLDHHLRQFGV